MEKGEETRNQKLETRRQKLEMGEAKLETGKLGEECLPRGPILWRESERPELGAAGVKFESDFVQGRGWSRDPDHPATNIFSRVRVGEQDSLIGFQFHGRRFLGSDSVTRRTS